MSANLELDNTILELHPRRSLQYDHPLMLPLIAPEVCNCDVTVGDNSFNAYVGSFE